MRFEYDAMKNIIYGAAYSLAPEDMSTIKLRITIRDFLWDNATMFEGISEMYISEEKGNIYISLYSKDSRIYKIFLDGTKDGVYIAICEEKLFTYRECLSMFIKK